MVAIQSASRIRCAATRSWRTRTAERRCSSLPLAPAIRSRTPRMRASTSSGAPAGVTSSRVRSHVASIFRSCWTASDRVPALASSCSSHRARRASCRMTSWPRSARSRPESWTSRSGAAEGAIWSMARDTSPISTEMASSPGSGSARPSRRRTAAIACSADRRTVGSGMATGPAGGVAAGVAAFAAAPGLAGGGAAAAPAFAAAARSGAARRARAATIEVGRRRRTRAAL